MKGQRAESWSVRRTRHPFAAFERQGAAGKAPREVSFQLPASQEMEPPLLPPRGTESCHHPNKPGKGSSHGASERNTACSHLAFSPMGSGLDSGPLEL